MSNVLFIGLTTLDIQYFVDEFPGSNTKVKTAPPQLLVGGPATNAAVAYAFFAGKAPLVTVIGDNTFRPYFEADFDQCGIDVVDVLNQTRVNPVLATVVTSKESGNRTIFTHNPIDVPPGFDAKPILNKYSPDILLIDGFYPELALPLCREAKKKGILVIFDGGSWKEHLYELLPMVDVAICSSDFLPPGCNHQDEIFEYLTGLGIPNVAITQGEKPILYLEDGEYGHVSVEPVAVTDTLGAGDFFHGAFCYFWQQNKQFHSALAKAAHFASATCTMPGTRIWLTKFDRHSFF
ncbi:PfkB family carbohydrate kinase [Gaoshiqia sediminis]|uniref:PfkB family carbohydrate kinase n=1 Tax=Gaoshiqia sediminis TaxID=2986998 RepID=A0AA41Y5C6_9BACT|nr:PfkB family carbohydrate kinase [Gaoshiqia sediminis]MCW0482145.1 PfkB family carbohydrate kinase [Gaoshiqia sediminis]